MKEILVTGGSGFYGELLIRQLVKDGYHCVNIDLQKSGFTHPNLTSIQGTIEDPNILKPVFDSHTFLAIFHCASILAHAVKDKQFLWNANVEGTRTLARLAQEYKVPRIIYTSSNCLWGRGFGRPIREDDEPAPIEIYGKSKWESEKILWQHAKKLNIIIIRCPTITDAGRLGLLGILFEFIKEGRKIWWPGGAKNRYQFIYAQDLTAACIKALDYNHSDIFNIGSDNVKTLKEVFGYVLQKANTGARLVPVPKRATILAMKIAYFFGLSPLGPYQYKMIAEDFIFDTAKIKEKLNWRPTLTNEEMLYAAYQYYLANFNDIRNRDDVSAHKKSAAMGILKLVKLLS